MGIIFDLVIIAIIALSTFLAYKKGLAVLAIKLCSVLIAIVVTLLLYRPIANLIINTTNIDETIQSAVIEKSMEAMGKENVEDDFSKDLVEKAAAGQLAATAKDISIQVINTAVIIILFFGIKFALRFVSVLADKVAKLPILNQFNKIGGVIYGIIRGLAIVYACLLLIGFVGDINGKNFLNDSVEQSNLGKMMYENNVIKILL